MEKVQNLNPNLDYLLKNFEIKIDEKESVLRRRNDIGGHFVGTINGIKYFFKWGERHKIENELKIIKNIQKSLENDSIIYIPKTHDLLIKANIAMMITEYFDMNHSCPSIKYTETIIKGLNLIKKLNLNFELPLLNYDITFFINEIKAKPITTDSINLKEFHITDIKYIEKYSRTNMDNIIKSNSNCFVHGDFVPHNFVVTDNFKLKCFLILKSQG